MIKRQHLLYGFAILGLIVLLSGCRSRVEPRLYRFLDYYTPPADLPQLKEKTRVIHSFQFNKDGDAEGWQPISGIDRFRVEGGKLKLRSINNDPYMMVKVQLNADLINAVRIAMKHSGWRWPEEEAEAEIFWTSSEEGIFSANIRAPFKITPDNKFHAYTILIDEFPNWRGKVSHFRLDPLRDEGEVEIDSISFVNLSLKESFSHQSIKWVPTETFIKNELRRVIFSPPPSRIEQKVRIPPKAVLNFGYGVMQKAWRKEGDGVLFSINGIDKKGETHQLFSHYIDPKQKKAHRQWFDGKIDLSPFEGEKLKIVLETMGSDLPAGQPSDKDDARYDYAVWSNPIIYSQEEENKLNVILIILDTLRADALGCYGYWRQTSPNIDKLVEDPHTVLFENAFSTAPWTFPAHKSLFTSRHLNLNLHYGEGRLFDRETTLAEVLHKAGYNTIGVTGGIWLSHKLGMAQGFDSYYESDRVPRAKIDEIYEKVADWLDRRRANSFFLLFHTYETHVTYIRTTFARGLERGRIPPALAEKFNDSSEEIKRLIYTATEEEKRYIRALYDGSVLEADRYVQKLLDKLSSLNLLKNTVIIITSDHGEEFWEHHPLGAMHGQSLYQEMLHIPLIIYLPHIKLPQKVIKTPVSLIDFFPTIIDLAGVKDFDKKRIMGVSLLPLIKGESDYDNYPLFAEVKDKIMMDSRLQAIIMEGHKYILSLDEEKEVSFKRLKIEIEDEELFDLTSDRGERKNLIEQKNELVERLREALQRFIEKKKGLLFPPKEEENIMLDEDLKRRLKALGYLK
ncbi:MAG: sulfatase [Candidatus Aminicenantes bacterium]|nr:sulfatase [Candidatus Aminicenantes bacterium]